MIRRVIQVGSAAPSSGLSNALYLNASTTEQLILQYYVQLADRTENFAAQISSTSLRLRVGYVPTTNQQITVQIDGWYCNYTQYSNHLDYCLIVNAQHFLKLFYIHTF